MTMCKELKQPQKFFNACKKCSRSKRIVLYGRFVFTTEAMLQMMKKNRINQHNQKCSKMVTKMSNSNNFGE